jgi:apolipoprotein N-acyltransferase
MALAFPQINRTDVIAFVAGVAVPFAFAPFGYYPLLLISLAILFNYWRHQTTKQALRTGVLFGLGMFGVGVSWVFVVIHEFGHTVAALAAFMTFLFILALSVYIGVAGAIVTSLRDRLKLSPSDVWLIVIIMPAVWLIIEWVRGWLFTGFPWLSLGYSLIDSSLAGWAPVIGVYGLTWLVALTAAMLLMLRNSNNYKWIFVAVIMWISGWGLGQKVWTQPVGESLSVALVQGNVPQSTKWNPDAIRYRLRRYAELTEPLFENNRLIIWPENSITVFYSKVKEGYFAPLVKRAQDAGSELLVGIPVLREDGYNYYTSMIVPGDDSQQYHKRHLVPFGEYLPLEWLRGLVNFFDLPMSRFSAGDYDQKPLEISGVKASVSICYEDAFATELLTQLPEATILVNGSNNAWFGDSFAPHQHLQISRMRSLETGRSTLRATTNGISAIIGSNGEVEKYSKQFETDVIEGSVQPRTGSTPYVIAGNYPILVVTILLLLFPFMRAYKKNSLDDPA